MKIGRVAPFLVLATALVWYGALTVRFHTYGAIGTDPATYVQMALDLSRRATVNHVFVLFDDLYSSGLSRDAFISPGYHVVPASGLIVPNFAFGFPLLLAIANSLWDEGAIYWVTPLLGALSLVVTFGLANELFRGLPRFRRYWIGALAVLLLAASPKQIQLALVSMSDVPAQLFCALAILFALRASRVVYETPRVLATSMSSRAIAVKTVRRSAHDKALWVVFCGLSLGIAYLIRHSAVILLVPLAVIATRWGAARRERVLFIVGALGIFALTALPDVLYRLNVLGSPFAVESAESTQLVWLDAPRQLVQILAALFSVTGFGPIVLLAPISWWLMARERDRFAAAVLSLWALVFVLFHAPLLLTGVFENSLRYLLPAYPAIALSIAYGVVRYAERVWDRLRESRQRLATRSLRYYAGALVLLIGLGIGLRALIGPERFAARAYGWMSETARRELDEANRQLPENAVIGVSDQMAGAAALYVHRDIFRPGNFLDPAREFPQFLQRMNEEHRPVYLLGDWNCSPIANASEKLPIWLARYQFEQTGKIIPDLPYECPQNLYKVKGE